MIPYGAVCGNEAIASLFPLDLSGAVVALRASIDASTRSSGVFAVGGVAYGYDRAVKANCEWERPMDGRTFHMTDLHARQNDFEGISDTEVSRIMVGAVGIVRKYASYCVAVSCYSDQLVLPITSNRDRDQNEMLAAFRSAYGYMCHLGTFGLGEKAMGLGKNGRQISYIFERGDEGQRGLIRFLDFLQDNPGRELFLEGYSLARETVTPKDKMEGIFHSADLIAWEWSKHVERADSGSPMRRSLSALVADYHSDPDKYGLTLSDGNRFFFRHFSPARINSAIGFFRETLVATSVAEVEAAFSRWKAAR